MKFIAALCGGAAELGAVRSAAEASVMADGSADWVVAVNVCPYCRHPMPDRTDDDYRLAACGMGGAWSTEFRRITTGYWFSEHCTNCGEFLSGFEYQPELVRVEFRPEPPNELVFDRWVAWYGGAGSIPEAELFAAADGGGT